MKLQLAATAALLCALALSTRSAAQRVETVSVGPCLDVAPAFICPICGGSGGADFVLLLKVLAVVHVRGATFGIAG